MPSRLVRARIKPGREAEFQALQRQLMDDVAAREPGAEVFEVRQSEDEPLTYVWFMSFTDDSAFERFTSAPYHTHMTPKALDCIDGDPVMEQLVDFRSRR